MVRRFNRRLKFLKKSSQRESSTFHSLNKTHRKLFSSSRSVQSTCQTQAHALSSVPEPSIFKNWQFSIIPTEFNFSHCPTIFTYFKGYCLPFSHLFSQNNLKTTHPSSHVPPLRPAISIFNFWICFFSSIT